MTVSTLQEFSLLSRSLSCGLSFSPFIYDEARMMNEILKVRDDGFFATFSFWWVANNLFIIHGRSLDSLIPVGRPLHLVLFFSFTAPQINYRPSITFLLSIMSALDEENKLSAH